MVHTNMEGSLFNLLRCCIKEYVSIIENKNTDTNTNKAKHDCWLTIEQRYNELTILQPRSLNELKQQWRCAKLDAKKKISSYKKQLYRTAGGPKPPSPDPVTLDIVDMIPLEFEDDSNMFDIDGNPLKNTMNDIKDSSTCAVFNDSELKHVVKPASPEPSTSTHPRTQNTEIHEPIVKFEIEPTTSPTMEVTTQKPILRSRKRKLPVKEPTLYIVKGMCILDESGNRILAKYYDKNILPTVKEQKAFEKNLFNKTHRADSEIIIIDGLTCVYKSNLDLYFYVMGSSHENELMLMSVLNALYESVSILLRRHVAQSDLMENLGAVMLAFDEICDGGVILDTDPMSIVGRAAVRTEDVPLGEQTVAQVLQSAKEQLKWSLLK